MTVSDIEETSQRRKALIVRLDGEEREMVERLARRWGTSLAGALRRLVREAEKTEGDKI